MSKNYRLRTTPGIDKDIKIKIDQDFDFIEVLSLKLKQSDVYTRFCADYGVIAGRVIANGGYGVPNVSVSVFVPLSDEDADDPVISTLYPYRSLSVKNEDGYRYNLLPYVQEYGGHTPTGTFPDREDVLTRSEVLEVYEKYYKYTVRTNDSGDFMIVGVPLGQQTIVMDADLSNIGCFSLRPSDLIRMGMGSEGQFDGSTFRSSTDLGSLPQIINEKREVEVGSFWGEEDLCNIGITRVDFDLRDLGIKIEPQAVFMGSLVTTTDEDSLGANCKPKFDTGNLCDLNTGPGKILAIRQTIYSDSAGLPILEQYNLPEGGNVIDSDGTWLVEVPMNLDYVTTNEFGEQVFSNDPTVGVPTKGKYRFKIQYQNEDGENSSFLRADYLIPNLKEYGWSNDPSADGPSDDNLQKRSYAFSLDWTDYGDTGTTLGQQIIQEAINCDDKFFEFNFNRVYTLSSFVDRWKWGFNRSRHLGIKEITNRECSTTTNRFPVNDGVRNFDLLFFLFNLLITIFTPIFAIIIIIYHFVARIYPPLVRLINKVIGAINAVIIFICKLINRIRDWIGWDDINCPVEPIDPIPERKFPRISLPMMSYPDCEACSCESVEQGPSSSDQYPQTDYTQQNINTSLLIDTNSIETYKWNENNEYSVIQNYCDVFQEGCEVTERAFNFGINQGFAGYSGPPDNGKFKFNNAPIATWMDQQSRTGSQSYTVSYSQALNMFNRKSMFIENINVMYTTVKNTDFNGVEVVSDTFNDQPLVLILDKDSLSQIGGPGSIITFTDLDNINDPNTTGATKNGFDTFAVTGTADYNLTSLVNKSVPYLSVGNYGFNLTPQTAQLYLKLTESIKEYKFKGGVEYFQVITGNTLGHFSQYVGDQIWSSFIGQYIYAGGGMRFRWGKGYYRDSKLGKLLNNTVKTIAFSPNPNTDLVVGGSFTKYNTNVDTGKIIQIDKGTGLKNTNFVYAGNGTTNVAFNGDINKIIVLSNGDQIIGGLFTTYNSNSANKLVKLSSANGHPIDSIFGSGIGGSNSGVSDIGLQDWDQSIIVGGKSFSDYDGTSINRNLIRINSSGTIDGTFSVGTQFLNEVIKIEIDNNNTSSTYQKIYVAVDSNNASLSKKILRLNTNGSVDGAFNFDLDVVFYSTVKVLSIKLQNDGKLLVGISISGNATYGGVPINGVFRLNSDGTLDNTFNNGVVGFGVQNNIDVRAIEVDNNNKIYVGGNFINKTYGTATVTGVFRLDQNGLYDPTFNPQNTFNSVTVKVYDIKVESNTVYIGGIFSTSNTLLNSNFFVLNDTGTPKTSATLFSNTPMQYWREVARGYNEEAKWIIESFNDKELVFLTRGTDLYTEKQTIEYDISKIFNKPTGTLKIKGQYYLNIPVKQSQVVPTSQIDPNNSDWFENNGFTPQTHDVINNQGDFLYRRSFSDFTPSNWTAFTNNSVKYYTSTDKSRRLHYAFNGDSFNISNFTLGGQGYVCEVDYNGSDEHSTVGFGFTQIPLDSDDPDFNAWSSISNYRNNVTYDQGRIEGCSFIGSNIKPGETFDLENTNNFARVFAPAYHLENPNDDVIMVNKQRLILRSDRLPTSTVPKVNGNNSLPLFMNDNFLILTVNEQGQTQQLIAPVNQQTDNTNNLQDFSGDTEGGTSDIILNSLTCEGLTSLSCYSGYGSTFGVIKPCSDNRDGDLTKQRIIGGCYYFVQDPYLNAGSIAEDFKYFAEWRARFRLNYAACRGVISHVFQNNWINGVLYSFAFNKKTIFDIQGNVKRYKFCGSKEFAFNPIRTNQGPLFYHEDTNTFYYRSTPYNGTPSNGKFIGQEPRNKTLFGLGPWEKANFKGMNDRNIFFPTTVMDLGPRDQFTKEICFNPQLDGYLVETLKSTSYNDTSNILLFFILSRLLNSTWSQRLIGFGDASINQLFSRSEDRLDGDVTQMFSINSEYGIVPFNDDNYDDDAIFLLDNDGPLIGLYFSSNTENRILLTPGTLTFGNVLQQNGYPKTQNVPMYKWKVGDTDNIFGNEKNDWFTNLSGGKFYTVPYQQMSFNNADYFQPSNGTGPLNGATGYIINYDSNGNLDQSTTFPNTQTDNKFVIGAPYHFYFGLYKGKTAMNKYISKYIIGTI
jgi:hypothetical protein